jgi:hypothetical protein
VDAIEIHTLQHHEKSFSDLWSEIGDQVLSRAAVLSISFPNMGEDTIPYLESLQSIITSCQSWSSFKGVQIWQTDGRPMSGDIGKGTTHKASNLASDVLKKLKNRDATADCSSKNSFHDKILSDIGIEEVMNVNDKGNRNLIDVFGGRHFIQLAGGTNNYSSEVAKEEGLDSSKGFGGFAFGGYARRVIGELLHELEVTDPGGKIENHPLLLKKCMNFANDLLDSVKKLQPLYI